jgi:hypothetical protein
LTVQQAKSQHALAIGNAKVSLMTFDNFGTVSQWYGFPIAARLR